MACLGKGERYFSCKQNNDLQEKECKQFEKDKQYFLSSI